MLKPITKGQKVTLRNGETVVVGDVSENYFWVKGEQVPWDRRVLE